MSLAEKMHYSPREMAALMTAVSWLRNELIWISNPRAEIDYERLGKLVESTSIAKIEEALGLLPGSLAMDTKAHITRREACTISARDFAHLDEPKGSAN